MLQLLEKEKISHLLPWSIVEDLGEKDCEKEQSLEISNPDEKDMENCETDENLEVSLEDSFIDEMVNSEGNENVDTDRDMKIAEEEDQDMSEIEIISSGDEDDEDGDVSFIFVPCKKIRTEY